MARCNDCNKFVGNDTDEEPEVQSEQFNEEDMSFAVDVRIVNKCAECGNELREATMTVEGNFEFDDLFGEHEGLEIEVDDLSRTERSEGKGRGLKAFYGFEGTVKLLSSTGTELDSVSISDDVQASDMEEV